MYDRILVPTDGSDPARRALDHAIELAGEYDATVRVVHAVDEKRLQRLWADEDARLQHGEQLVSEAATVGRDGGVEVEQHVDVGVVHETILEQADDCDLLVMGSHGRTGLERYLLGSVTEKVVRLAEVPVVTVRAGEGEQPRCPYENVLIPTDGSDGAVAAIDQGVEVAAAHDATVHGLSVVDERVLAFAMGGTDELRETLTGHAERAVQSVEAAATTVDVAGARTEVRHGIPHREIVAAAEETDADLVVMGTHGRTGFDRYLLGSVTERVLRTSPAAVMTVRAPADGD